jgi:hypothetical protein
MNTEEIGRLLDAVKEIGDAEYDDAVSTRPEFALGVAHLRERLLSMLDVRDYVTLDEVADDKRGLVVAMAAHCERLCWYSRKAPPGEHAVCTECTLAPTTIERLRKQVAKATEGQNDSDD